MELCPCCNARLKEALTCPRCQADLSSVISSEQAAQLWLSKAIQSLQENKVEQSLGALELSLRLKRTTLAGVLRDFLIHRQCRDVLNLLAKQQWLSARKELYRTRLLLPYSKQLQQLYLFTDYLWVKNAE